MTPSTITFETDALAAAMREVRGAVQRRNTIPIVANVLIEADGAGVVRLTATDLDVMVTRRLAGASDREIAFTVDAHRLADVVGSFNAGSQTSIKFDSGAATVSSGRARLRFATLPKTDFPILSQRGISARFSLDAKALTRALNVVRHAVSTEETRYYLNGVLLHAADGMLRYAATDGHRLARYVDALPAGAEHMPDTILRTRCIDLARVAAEARDETIHVAIGDGKVAMTIGDFAMVAKVADGTFPDYVRVIPTANDKSAVIDRDAFLEAISRVAIATSDKVRAVKITTGTNMLRATVTSPEHGEAADEVQCDYSGAPLEIGFNSRYLRDALAALDVDHVDLALGDAAGPALITSPKASGVSLVLMPIRV
ncbi:DNA polymerase III subunit beta [uncultured Sphingomonas sp.]|uniref:DNA polymerase III subunit beta n=1 Tax=uncultured Sphingomonas sp. TaxID=158754 RepID=UPI002594ECE3|nr:DNA polymerase III subunit beta [uncultured Sphingomonas sp.]